MHFEQRRFVQILRQHLPRFFSGCRVLEVGAANVNGSARELFSGGEYTGLDLAPGPGVDVVASGHLYRDVQPFDCVFSCECFEHNPHWRQTFENMIALAGGGALVFFTCATEGRPEHGTQRTQPGHSPGTQAVGWDHYRNLTEADFAGVPFARHFAAWRFAVNPGSQDLYFAGLRHGAARQLEAAAALARVTSDVDELVGHTLALRGADALSARGLHTEAAQQLAALRAGIGPWARGHLMFKQTWALLAGAQPAAALEVSRTLLALERNADTLWQYSLALHANGDAVAALAAANEAAALAPNHVRMLLHLATLQLAAGAIDEAEPLVQRAVAIDPTDATAQHRLSIVAHKRGRRLQAVEAAVAACRLAPANASFSRHLQGLQGCAVQPPSTTRESST